MRQRHLICQRCGAEQWAAGRVIEEAERELSYRWCRKCLDEHGPCAKQQGGEAAGIQTFFSGLAQAVIAQAKGADPANARAAADPRMLRVGAKVNYHGSKKADWGPAWVRSCNDPRTVLIVTEAGKQIRCNWSSVSFREEAEVVVVDPREAGVASWLACHVAQPDGFTAEPLDVVAEPVVADLDLREASSYGPCVCVHGAVECIRCSWWHIHDAECRPANLLDLSEPEPRFVLVLEPPASHREAPAASA